MSKTKCPTCGGDYIYDTTAESRDPDLDDVRVYDRELDLGDLWYTYNRQFVSDLPWYQRFLIWLFPRMYILEKYNP